MQRQRQWRDGANCRRLGRAWPTGMGPSLEAPSASTNVAIVAGAGVAAARVLPLERAAIESAVDSSRVSVPIKDVDNPDSANWEPENPAPWAGKTAGPTRFTD